MLKLTTKKTKWFDVPQDESGETKVEILHLKPGEIADIEAKSNQITGRQDGEDFHTEINFALNERTKKYVSRAIVNWKGFVGANGKNLTCNERNKLEVLKEFDWFGDFIEDCRQELAAEIEEMEEDAEKN